MPSPPPAQARVALREAPKVVPLVQADPLKMQSEKVEDMSLGPEEVATINVFQRNTPSVVNITNIKAVNSYYSLDVQKLPAGTGSGFIWDQEGHVVTNFHVIKGAAEVKVTLLDQTSYTARVVGADPDKDVAVLQLVDMPAEKVAELKPVELGRSSSLLVGQKVLAIGNPFGLDHTLTQGIISGVGRELNNGSGYIIKNVVQTDAAINPGNSGGILLDSKGRVIGINTAIADPTGKGSSSGVGFAIPIDAVQGLVDQILQYGQVIRPVLGITVAPPQVLKQLGQKGVLVLEVPKGTPAEKAGLKSTIRDRKGGSLILGDIVVGIDGNPVENYSDLLNVLDGKRPGDVIEVELLRSQNGKLSGSGEAVRIKVKVELGERSQVTLPE